MNKPTQEQLSAAFDLVKNKKDWKNPINAKLDIDMATAEGQAKVELITEAIVHFTGSIPCVINHRNKVHFSADGYYSMESMLGCF